MTLIHLWRLIPSPANRKKSPAIAKIKIIINQSFSFPAFAPVLLYRGSMATKTGCSIPILAKPIFYSSLYIKIVPLCLSLKLFLILPRIELAFSTALNLAFSDVRKKGRQDGGTCAVPRTTAMHVRAIPWPAHCIVQYPDIWNIESSELRGYGHPDKGLHLCVCAVYNLCSN